MQVSTVRGAAVDAMAEPRRRQSVLQGVADAAYRQVFKESSAPRVQLFGSRAQGMATATSDYDFLLEVPEEPSVSREGTSGCYPPNPH